MTEISPKIYHWLQSALTQWQDEQIINETQRTQITALYQVRASHFLPMFIGILAALFIGGGIILVLAHNWKGLSQPMRAVISFMPLLISQILLWWSYHKSTVARESSAVFHALALGASIALISQTFHMGGDLEGFLFAWLMLLLPVAVCYGAQTGVIAVTILATSLLLNDKMDTLMILATHLGVVAVLFVHCCRGERIIARWFYWFYVAIVVFSSGERWKDYIDLSFEALFLALVGVYYVAGATLFPRLSYLKNPLRFLGAIGLIGFIIYYCFWAERRYHSDSVILFSYWVFFALLMVATLFVAMRKKLLDWRQVAFACVPLLIFILSAISVSLFNVTTDSPRHEHMNVVLYWLIMGYFLVLGIVLSIQGQAQNRWGKMNAGLGVVISVITARFFDYEMSFLLRGVLFLIIGIILLVFNLWYLKKTKTENQDKQENLKHGAQS